MKTDFIFQMDEIEKPPLRRGFFYPTTVLQLGKFCISLFTDLNSPEETLADDCDLREPNPPPPAPPPNAANC